MKEIAGSLTTYFQDGSKTVTKFYNEVFYDEKHKRISMHQTMQNLTNAAKTIAETNYLSSTIQFLD
tara:strand:+ start:278 stop:475 length:198 start_codon:yes stop_codon:yes gene_type:complete